MPYFELLSFLLFCGDFRESSFKGGFNALLRASFFSTVRLNNNGTNNEFCFNALLRASFFSTIIQDTFTELFKMVSMPYFGLLSFLRGRNDR